MSALPETPSAVSTRDASIDRSWQPRDTATPPLTASARAHQPRPQALPRPLSERQRAVYRRRRIVAAVLLLVVTTLVVLGVRGLVSFVTGLLAPAEAVAAPVVAADDPVRVALTPGGQGLPMSPIGVDDRGLVEPPAGEAVWFTGLDRVTPGDLGTAIIVGDVAGEDGAPTAFAEVASLAEGDRVVVTFGDGVTLELDVVSASLVDRGDLESSEVLWGAQSDTRRVALVTSDEVTDGDASGTFLAVAELG